MKYPLKVDKLTSITVDGKPIAVNSLSSETRHEIETLDIFKQELRNVVLEYEKADILVKAKLAHVEQLIAQELMQKGDSPPEGE